MTKLLEILRIVCCVAGIYLAYAVSASEGLFWLVLLFVIPVTGLTAIESLCFAKRAAIAKGREVGSDYQQQSALNNLATAVVGLIVLVFHLGVAAEITIILVALCFFAFSAIKHALEYFSAKKSAIHLQRLVLSLLLWIACLPIVIQAWPSH
jgi:hypothetical protein